jgi:hypothetical protein
MQKLNFSYGRLVNTFHSTALFGKSFLLLLGITLVLNFNAYSQDLIENYSELRAPEIKSVQFYGSSVSMSDNYMAVGASGNNGGNSGAVYLYEKDEEGAWIFNQKIMASDSSFFNYFGYSVSVTDEYLAVSSIDIEYETGAVYVYSLDDAGNWGNEQKIVAVDGVEEDRFGEEVVLKYGVLAVGAPGNRNDGIRTGSVYLYNLEASTGNWIEVQKLFLEEGDDEDQFGYALDIFEDDLVIGSIGTDQFLENTGSINFYKRNSENTWDFVKTEHEYTEVEDSNFGASISIHGHDLIVGAPGENFDRGAVYFFQYTEEYGWNRTLKHTIWGPAYSRYGCEVSIYGNYSLVGAKDLQGPFGTGGFYLHRKAIENPDLYWYTGMQVVNSLDSTIVEHELGGSVCLYKGDYAIGAPLSLGPEEELFVGKIYSGALNIPTNVESKDVVLDSALENKPNPFKGQTVVSFELDQATYAKLIIRDLSGKILNVIEGEYPAGLHEETIDLGERTGTFFYTLETADFSWTKKMICID